MFTNSSSELFPLQTVFSHFKCLLSLPFLFSRQRNLSDTRRAVSCRYKPPLILFIFALGLVLNGPSSALAAPDAGVEEPGGSGIFVYRGNQSGGISVSSNTIVELQVKELYPNLIAPDAGTAGIYFSSTSGANVVLKSGEFGTNIDIQTRNAPGILLQSSGIAPAPQTDTVLGIPIPGRDQVSGGVVQLQSFSNITTTTIDSSAHGIEAKSSTSGYPDAVTKQLEKFDESSVSFAVVSVDSLSENVSTTTLEKVVQAHPVDADGKPVEGNGGSFIIRQDGTFEFIPGTAFDDLDKGNSRTSVIDYVVSLTTSNGTLTSDAYLLVTVKKNDDGTLSYIKSANFPDFGVSWKADPENPITNIPSVSFG